MTFRYCMVAFECDSCGNFTNIIVDDDLENIPSVMNLAEHAFDQRARETDPAPERNGNQHMCSACVLKRELAEMES